jgi:pimeloyl-ACP methyl ester carboxylesterase
MAYSYGTGAAVSIEVMPASVVLVHGLRGRSGDLEPVSRALQGAGYEVSSPDLPGHGSRTDEPFSIGESLVTIAEAAAGSTGSPVLIGQGLGGHLCIQAASITGHAAGVIAVGCGTQALTWILDSYRIAFATHQVLPDQGAALSALAATTFVGGVPRHTRTSTPGQFFDTLGQLDSLNTPAALARLSVPVRLLNGQWDRFRMQERAFLAAARDSALVRQPGVRLAVKIRRPEATATRLIELLQQLP